MSTGQPRLRIVLDAITVALCLFLLSWIFFLDTVFATYREDWVALGVAVVYPVLDLVVLMTVADTAFAYLTAGDQYDTGNLVDNVWAASLATFAAAALLSRRSPAPTKPAVSVPSTSSLWLPYVPLLLAGTLGPLVIMSGLERLIVPVVVVAVCARQMVPAWENRRLLAAAADQALRDPLTGLANRTLFHDRLAHAMMLRSRDDRSVTVVSLDLDDFKLVNDSLGHPAADSLLVHVGHRLTESVRPGDTAARAGGDEFALLLEGSADDSCLIAQQVAEAFNEPFVVEARRC